MDISKELPVVFLSVTSPHHWGSTLQASVPRQEVANPMAAGHGLSL